MMCLFKITTAFRLVLLQDLDFLEMYPEGIQLQPELYHSLLDTIERDCRWVFQPATVVFNQFSSSLQVLANMVILKFCLV